MNELKMKAKAGVTLVELLVVILIVTILSVSLLPLLKPFIEEAKYAAEPIPVLANLQTKIELYAYDHEDKLPCTENTASIHYYTWVETDNTPQSQPSGGGQGSNPQTPSAFVGKRFMPIASDALTTEMTSGHIEDLIDVDWQDLKGKRMRPDQFQYCVTHYDGAGSYCYAVGVFGDGNGLTKGTGYAVCKLVDIKNKRKVVGTWKKYKADEDASQLGFVVDAAVNAAYSGGKKPLMPLKATLQGANSQAMLDGIIAGMEKAGWEFN